MSKTCCRPDQIVLYLPVLKFLFPSGGCIYYGECGVDDGEKLALFPFLFLEGVFGYNGNKYWYSGIEGGGGAYYCKYQTDDDYKELGGQNDAETTQDGVIPDFPGPPRNIRHSR